MPQGYNTHPMLTERDLLKLSDRARLIGELQDEGLRVALTIGGDEIDMLVSFDGGAGTRGDLWIPIRTIIVDTAESRHSPAIEYANNASLLIVTDVRRVDHMSVRTYALTPGEVRVVNSVLIVASDIGSRKSAEEPLGPHTQLNESLRPFAVGPGQWRTRLSSVLRQSEKNRLGCNLR